MTEEDRKVASASKDTTKTDSPPTSAIEAIEEDDEFEEFEPCRWDTQDEDADDSQQWKDNWDDDDIDDEFTMQLRAELEKS